MANLSNINDKFLVTTGGNVGIGNTSPTLSTLTVGIGSTNSPSQICQLAGSGSGVYSVLSLTNTNGTAADNNGVGLDFHVNAAYSATGRIQIIHPTAQSGTTTNSSMQFLTYGTVSGVTTFSPRMTIDYRGNVGIGTTSPSGVKFQTVQTTSGEWTGGFKNYTANGYGLRVDMSNSSSVQSALQVYTGTGTGFVVKNTGKVGIGETAPAAKLDVKVASNEHFLVSDSLSTVALKATNDAAAAYVPMSINGSALTINADSGGNVGIGVASDTSVKTFIKGSDSGTNNFQILTRNSSDENVLAVRNDGKVGIGTTSPGGKLHIKGDGDAANLIRLQHDGTGTNGFFDINVTDTQANLIANYSSTAIPMVFLTGALERMRINSSGNLLLKGTGTTSLLKFDSSAFGQIQATGNTLYYDVDTQIFRSSAGTERMRITSTGQVQVGYYNTARGGVNTTFMTGKSGTTYLELNGGDVNGEGGILFAYGSGGNYGLINYSHVSDIMQFYTVSGERMRITSLGYLKASNDGTYVNAAQSYHELNQTTGSEWSTIIHNNTATPYGLYIKYSSVSPNNATEIIYFADSAQQRFYVTSAGAVYGNGTYGTISDKKLKENIVDATSKLDDINKLKVRNFNFKDKPEEKHIGFIAQEFEEVFPSMVETTQDKDKDNNTPIEDSYTKTIKSSVLIPMLVKSIQELKAEIELLKNK